MLFTALNRFVLIVSLALASSWPGAALGDERQTGTSLVARLYKDFAWQAIVSIPDQSKETKDAFGKEFARQNEGILQKYLDPTLSSLVVRDAKCTAKTREICNLDFDPIFASQDPSAVDLVVKSLAPGKVSVEYKYPSSGEKIKLEFRVAIIAGKWKITDIIYKNMGNTSLRKMLMRKFP